jgi:hypothetical protein
LLDEIENRAHAGGDAIAAESRPKRVSDSKLERPQQSQRSVGQLLAGLRLRFR